MGMREAMMTKLLLLPYPTIPKYTSDRSIVFLHAIPVPHAIFLHIPFLLFLHGVDYGHDALVLSMRSIHIHNWRVTFCRNCQRLLCFSIAHRQVETLPPGYIPQDHNTTLLLVILHSHVGWKDKISYLDVIHDSPIEVSQQNLH